ncbi:hypothetical protein L210DRAFT_3645026 [Boletus edulis BED1]|uniref:Uncharacterized protein n=1 Tax=Boletus edulis BED1 TaxID=1328754 RepID=A0AAD4GFE3_BOLED|nr:hypothetical protein L210DRAFT_3645026 [Boletus edulis BED1]
MAIECKPHNGHLSAADEDERTRIQVVKAMSLEAARKIVFNSVAANPANPSLPSAPGPSSKANLPSVQRTATLQGLAKRAREAPDAQQRVGKRKCARNKENMPPEVQLRTSKHDNFSRRIIACHNIS